MSLLGASVGDDCDRVSIYYFQTVILRVPAVRRKLKIPVLVKHKPTELPANKGFFKVSYPEPSIIMHVDRVNTVACSRVLNLHLDDFHS